MRQNTTASCQLTDARVICLRFFTRSAIQLLEHLVVQLLRSVGPDIRNGDGIAAGQNDTPGVAMRPAGENGGGSTAGNVMSSNIYEIAAVIILIFALLRCGIYLLRLTGWRAKPPELCWLNGALLLGSLGIVYASMVGFGVPLYALLLFSLLLQGFTISTIDQRYLVVPSELMFTLAVTGAFYAVDGPRRDLLDCVIGGLVGGGMLFGIMLYYSTIRKVAGLGFGDIQLATAIGATTGVGGIGIIIAAGSLTTLLFAVSQSVIKGQSLSLRERIPFGPGLIAAMIAYLVLEQ